MNIPKKYQWLLQEDGPIHLHKALELFGVTEIVGPKHNPTILSWAKETGVNNVYKSDEIAWCGLFLAVIMQRANRTPVEGFLWALNWAKFGQHVTEPMLGDVLVFKRTGGGHVGLYVGEDATAYHVLGGNEGNKVDIIRILKTRLYQSRRPLYKNQPVNIRKILISSSDAISINES